jgi:multidrug efflux pump subunit AcrA (membrane-fusion protein)
VAEPVASSVPAGLLEFERHLRACKSAREIFFVAVNEPVRILRYDQAVLWQRDPLAQIVVASVSGLADVDANVPYIQWMSRLFKHLASIDSPLVFATDVGVLPEDLAEGASEWCPEHLLHCSLASPAGQRFAGLLFSRAEPFSEQEIAIAEWMAGAVAFALWAWYKQEFRLPNLVRGLRTRKAALITGGVVLVLAIVPVRLSALAPAEITPSRPIPVTSPVDGVVKQVAVSPNQAVKKGDLLVILDDTTTRNRLEVANKALDTSRAELQRAINKAFSDEASKAEVQLLDARSKEKVAEVSYLSELSQKLRLVAPQDGIAIFTDVDSWTGRPVQTGEKIMILADPAEVMVTVYVPPDDAIQLESKAEVRLFLNVAPLSSLEAEIAQTSYEAVPTPDGSLAYVVRAALKEKAEPPRIGLKGTAKVYANRVTLAYYLLRKPIAFVRKSLGI